MNNLDKIIELTHGKWPNHSVKSVSLLNNEIVQAHGYLDDNGFTKAEYDKRLKELTGRPDVKDWPEWAEALTQDKNGEFIAWDYTWGMTVSPDSDRWEVMEKTISITDSLGYGNTITTESWKNSLITREEAEMVDNKKDKWIPEPGTECEYRIGGTWFGECDFIGRKPNGSLVVMIDGEYKSYHETQIAFRPVENQKDKAINQIAQMIMTSKLGETYEDTAVKIINNIKSGEIKID